MKQLAAPLAVLLFAAPSLAAPPATTQNAPPATQTVLAEGRAAINPATGALGAKQAAVALALRNAVERVTGTYVAASTLTRNHQLLKDEVLTRADGYAVLSEIVRAETANGVVRVVIRATVSTRPLAERLKALRLTRAFPVTVIAPQTVPTADLETALTDAGFPVTPRKADAAILVRVSVLPVTVAETALDTAAGAMTLHSVRATVRLVATRAETGETVASLSASDTQSHIAVATAATEAATTALATLLPRLTDALLILPAQISEPVQIVVTGVKSATDAAALTEAIALHAPGVQSVTCRGFTGERAVYEADVLAAATPLLARALESAPGLTGYRLRVSAETRNRITLTAHR